MKTKITKLIDTLEIISKSVHIDFNNEKTNYLGFICHPIADHACVMKDSKLLVLDSKGLPEFVDWKIEEIRKHCKTLTSVFMMTNKPYRLDLLQHSLDVLSNKEFNELLQWIWVTTEFPNQRSIFDLVKLFKRTEQKFLMSKEELKVLKDLQDDVTIYRGLQGSKSKVRGLSWTIDLEKAKWFANRYDYHGAIYSAKVSKDAIFMYCNRMNENEVVINPFKLKEVKKLIS